MTKVFLLILAIFLTKVSFATVSQLFDPRDYDSFASEQQGRSESCQQDLGRSGLRRLSHAEYRYAMIDLFALKTMPQLNLTAEAAVQGHHNIANALAISQVLLENYLQNANLILDQVFQEKSSPIFTCDLNHDSCAYRILVNFATKAYRRPPTKTELEKLWGIYAFDRKKGIEAGLKHVMQYILVSPHFIFRNILPANESTNILSDFELASRLSFFLWSSIPDQALLADAINGKLRDPEVLRRHVTRMLDAPKAKRLLDTFAEDWLELDKLKSFVPDPSRFPKFTTSVREALIFEIKSFLYHIWFQKRPLAEILTANYTFLNQELASFYGIDRSFPDHKFYPVMLNDPNRQGLLLKAGVLALTSVASDTSVVQRGKWVLNNILCRPPPDPPGNFELPEFEPTNPQSKRERFEVHRKNPICAGCHVEMDPIGFGLDHFDAIGLWRTMDHDGFPIDSQGSLGGQSFGTPGELVDIIEKDQSFKSCLTQKIATFALGRLLGSNDSCLVERISQNLDLNTNSFYDLVAELVTNEIFYMEKGSPR